MKKGFNYGRFFSALKKVIEHSGEDASEYKNYIVGAYTDGRTIHVHEMSYKEYSAACGAMEAAAGIGYIEERRKARSELLKQLQRMGIDTTDWNRINAFCEDKRIAGKPFGRMTAEELRKVAVKARSIQNKGGLKKPSAEEKVAALSVFILNNNSNNNNLMN